MNLIKFKEWNCVLERGTYPNGRTALQLNDAADGMPIATATVNVPDASLEPGEVMIKNYSENEGMSQALMNAGIISPPIRTYRTAHVFIMIHALLSNESQVN